MSSSSLTKIDLSQPDKFQMALTVTKNSRLGITSNKRLLVIKKGYLYYYSNVPKKFKGESSIVQTIHELPKCSIQIVNIKQIKGYQINSSYFSIQFDAKNMLQRQDIRKTMTLEEYNFSPKNMSENIVWQFTCDNQFIKQRWVAALEGLQTFYTKEKKDIEKFFNQHKDKDNSQMKSSSSGGRNSHVPWRESQSGNYKKSGDVSFLQLMASKSNDQIANERINEQVGNIAKTGQLNVPTSSNVSVNRVRGNSVSKQKQGKSQFMKHYTPDASNTNVVPLMVPHASDQQSLHTPKSSISRNDSKDSPIRQLQLSDVHPSPIKESVNVNNMFFSKTQKAKISDQTINEDENESNRSPGLTPLRNIQRDNSSGYDINDQADQFQLNIYEVERSNIAHSQPYTNAEDPGQQIYEDINKSKKRLFRTNEEDINNEAQTDNILASEIDIDFNDNYKNNKKSTKHQSLSPLQISDKAKHSSSSKLSFPSHPQSLSFYTLHNYLFSSSLSFPQRIQLQQYFHKKLHEFSSECSKLLASFLQLGKDQQQNNYSILFKTTNYTLMRHQPTKTMFKLAFVTSQALSINGQEKIYFDEEALKNLKREFKVYSDIQKLVVLAHLKTDSNFRIRVPLIALIEYKGVVALVTDQSYLEGDNISINTYGISSDVKKTYQKEIDVLCSQDYQLKDFSIISAKEENCLVVTLLPQVVSNRLCKEQAKKSYLKRLLSIKRPEKHHNIEFNPPFTKELITKAHQSNASTSIESLQQYISTLERIQQFQGICPKEEIIEVLKMCVFCKQIRKIYRSAQGEIQQTHFLNLIFKKQPEMLKMLQQSGCDDIPQLKGVLFSFIEHYLGISCSINEKALNDLQHYSEKKNNKKQPDIISSTQVQPRVQTLDISRLEIFQAFQSLEKFISQEKAHLAHEAIKIIQNLNLQQFSSELLQNRLQLTYYQASLAYLQNDYLKCIQQSKRYEKIIRNHQNPKLFDVYLLMLKSYSHFSDQEFRNTFDKLIKLIEFNYGHDNSTFISVYCISSFYFSQMSQKAHPDITKVNQLYSLSCKLLHEAQRLSLKYFGQTSPQFIDTLLDLSRLYELKQSKKSQNYLLKARTLIISTQNNEKLVDYLIFQLKRTLNSKKFSQSLNVLNQCEELIYSNMVKIESKKIIQLMKIKFELALQFGNDKLFLAEQAVQQLWRGDRDEEKREALVMAAKLCRKLNIINEDSEDIYGSNLLIGSISSISSQNSSQTKEQVTKMLIDLLSSQGYSRDNSQNETLISRIKQMIEEDQLMGRNQTSDSKIKRLLLQV